MLLDWGKIKEIKVREDAFPHSNVNYAFLITLNKKHICTNTIHGTLNQLNVEKKLTSGLSLGN